MTSPDLVITDAQVHIWAAPRPERPWAPGGEDYSSGVDNLSSAQRTPLSAAELLREMDQAGVSRVVLVPPTFEGDRNDLALAAARRWPDRFGVMGRLDVTDPRSRQRLATWLEQPGMLGIRLTFHWGDQQRWLHDGTLDWFWPEAEQAGIPVAVYPPGAVDRIGEVAAAHPGLRLVIDHFAMPLAARDDALQSSADALVAIADLPNICIKASALPSYTDDEFPFPHLVEPIRRVLAAYGPRRVFWGSEMTRLGCSYAEAVRLFTEELDFLSGEDLAWVMGRGISEWLGWPVSPALAQSSSGVGSGGALRDHH